MAAPESEQTASEDTAETPKVREFPDVAAFLRECPPGETAYIEKAIEKILVRTSNGPVKETWRLTAFQIQLYCAGPNCQGTRFFTSTGSETINHKLKHESIFFHLTCRNCWKSIYSYALVIDRRDTENTNEALITKMGQIPAFGVHAGNAALGLAGADRELFLKALAAESKGLGIGAFSYYRRIVDNQWKKFLAEIIKVAERSRADAAVLKTLQRAAEETQFSKAVDLIKDAVPDVLRIDGHNPLSLLYSATSDGLHDRSDAECLDLSLTIRLVLVEMAERVQQTLKDQAELSAAVGRLTATKKK